MKEVPLEGIPKGYLFREKWYSIACEITYNNFEISLVVFLPLITTNRAIICLYHYPQKVCNFHM